MFDIWNYTNELATEVYHKDNILIRIKKNDNAKKRLCVIYCSSNNIWYPNTESCFREQLIEKDRYEWTNFSHPDAEKEIFVRDIYKSWYVTGVNSRLNTIDALIAYLKDEVQGFSVVTIGSSAGGYLAAILGYFLDAEHTIAFSPQFELENQWAIDLNPFLRNYQSDPNRNKYYDLKAVLAKSNVPIFYIVPIKSEIDRYHYNHIQGINCIHPFVFNDSHHGVVMLKENLSAFIYKSTNDLLELQSIVPSLMRVSMTVT